MTEILSELLVVCLASMNVHCTVSHLILPQAVVDKLVLMGIQVVACIADNAANMKAVLHEILVDQAAIAVPGTLWRVTPEGSI